ncbi:MAG: two-component regulator propeller domain-containing protein [Candidatus Latescibacter sp.]|nr:two-component regulator propeller domain-containing protein [Candidatus Latescibacter sp.]
MNTFIRKRFRFLLAILCVGVCNTSSGFAQEGWTHWTNSNTVNGMVLQGDYLWMKVNEGIIRYNTVDGTYRRFTTADGVPNSQVTPFLVDRSGAVWFGSYDMVCRYNGSSWEYWPKPNSLNSFNGSICSLFDSKGNIWISVGNGVEKFDGQNWKSWIQINNDRHTYALVLKEDIYGNIWIGADNGVYKLENDSWRWFYRNDNAGDISNDIISMTFDLSNNLWVGTPVDVGRFDGKTWLNWVLDPEFANRHVQSLIRDDHGNIWAGTRGGVSRFDGNSWTNWRTKDGITTFVDHLFEDSKGNIWAASKTHEWQTGTAGIYRYDGLSWNWFNMDNGLPGNLAGDILESRDGVVWVGMDKGLFGFQYSKWFTWQWMQSMERSDPLLSIFDDGEGHIWVGTDMGVSRFDGNNWEMLMDYPGHRFAAPTSAAPFIKDTNGKIWVGLAYWDERDGNSPWTIGGVSRYENPGWLRLTRRDLPFWPGLTRALLVDREGYLWAGTETDYEYSGIEGAVRFDGVAWKTWMSPQKGYSALRSTYTFLQSSRGTIWAGTENGAMSYDGVSWRHYTETEGLYKGAVPFIIEDREQRIWALSVPGYRISSGNYGGGLNRFDGEHWTQVEGLPDTAVTCMLLDRQGKIWVGAQNGVSRLDNGQWKTWRTGYELGRGYVSSLGVDKDNVIWVGMRPEKNKQKIETGGGISRFDGQKWQTWTTADGFPSNTVTCITVDSANDIWVGMSGGISRFSNQGTQVTVNTSILWAMQISSIHPNPFNLSTAIEFTLPHSEKVSLIIYSVTGQKVRELVSGNLTAGEHTAVWDGRDNAGRPVSSGVYLTRLCTGQAAAMRRMVLLK